MKRYIITCMAALMSVLYSHAESISVGDVVMNQGETTTVAISLTNNHTDLVSFQMDLYLPDGITINKSGCSLSNRFESGQTLTIGKQADGAYRLTSTSFSLKPITGTSGIIISLSLTAQKETGATSASIKNIMFATNSSERVTLNNISFVAAVREHQSVNMTSIPSVTYGDTYTLPSKTDQGQTLTWTVENTSVATISGNVIKTKGVGSTNITATQTGSSCYFPFTKTYTLNVNKAPLTISANNCSMVYGSTMPTFSFNCVGLKNGDTSNALTTQPSYNCTATSSSAAGQYDINISGAEAQNYEITYRKGLLTINAKNSSYLTIDNIADVEYNGFAHTPEIVVKDGDKILTRGNDYSVSFSNNINAGIATVTVTGKGNYTGTKYATFTINRKNITFMIIDDIADVTYDGMAQKPAIIVKDGGTILNNGTDYTISYSDNINAGVATVTVTGKGNYTGEKAAIFIINRKSSATFTIDDIAAVGYNGRAQAPVITVRDRAVILNSETDYDVTYSNNINVGIASVTINFKGNYVGTKTATFLIENVISFADSNVKAICVANWDADGNGEISTEELESVTDLGNVFRGKDISSFDELKYFTNITSIPSSAFYGCSSLVSIIIPDNVKLIGSSGFTGCSKLTSVNIPNGVTTIESETFYKCSNLTSITIPNNVTTIGSYAFSGSSSLTHVTIPNSVTTIGSYSFSGCSSLTHVTIPNSVTSIGSSAFSGCSSMTSVTIPNSVTSIGNSAFYNCSSLTSFTIPNSVKSIGSYAFSGCKYLISVIIPNSVKSIDKSAFQNCSSLTSVIIGDSVTEIGNSAFSGCLSLTKVELNCNAITSKSYNKDSSLKNIFGEQVKEYILGKDVTLIGDYAFSYCIGMISATIPNSVTGIGNYAFYNTNLKTLIVGTGVLSIGSNAFSNPVKTIWLTNTPPQGYKNAQGTINYVANSLYSDLSNMKEYKFLSSMFEVDGVRYVPVSPSERTCDAIDCTYEEFTTDVSINPTVSYKGVSMKVQNVQSYTFYQNAYIMSARFDNDGDIGKYALYKCNNLQTVVFGQNVISIGEYAFKGCSKLEDITIPDVVESIGQYAFSDCTGLEKMKMGGGNNTISNYAFSGCSGMKSAVIGDGQNIVGDYVFSGCRSLSSVTIGNGENSIGNYAFSNCKNLEFIHMGEGTNIINQYAFQNCSSLPSLTIPGSVNSIGNYAFSGCTGLKTVIMEDRKTECELKLGYNGSNNSLFTDCPLDSVYIGRNISFSLSPFYGNKTLRSVIIADKETEIANNEFYGCSNLQNVQIGNAISSIGNSSFQGCSKVVKITLPNAVKTIGNYAFSGCNSLASISLGNGTNTINQYAFQNCSSLPSLTIPGSVNSIGNYAFSGCTGLKTVIMEDRKTEGELRLGYNGSNPIFVDCPLDSIYIGLNISYSTGSDYGYSPFYRNTTLRSVTITDKETEISENEFYGCINLQNVKIGDGVNTIGNWAFSGCSKLKNFSFGTQVKTIGKEAFSDCTAVRAISSKAQTPPTCGSQALDDINKWECKLYVPEGYVSEYQTADQWKEFLFIEEGDIPDFLRGDVNGDGNVDMNDATFVTNIILGTEETTEASDVNNDGEINMSDVMFIVNYIKNGKFPDE